MSRRPLPRWTLAVAAAILILHAWPGAFEHLGYLRSSVESGQWHRLITAHLLHASWRHLFWNVLIWLALAPIAEESMGRRFVPSAGALALGLGMLVHLAQPDLTAYCGLSGLVSAVFAFALTSFGLEARREGRPLATAGCALATAAFIAKLGYETTTGQAFFAAQEGTVAVPLVHLAGFAAGALAALRG